MKSTTCLESFAPGGVALVVGTGGIGMALADRICSSGRFSRLIAAGRSPRTPAGSHATAAETRRVDLRDENSIAELARHVKGLDQRLQLVVCAAGILHRGSEILPERRLEDLSPQALAEVFAVNAFGPMLLAKHLVPLLPRRERSVFAAISARVGSIGDNRLGGWYAYRASKSALNQMLRCAAIEMRRRAPAGIVAALHPGTVDTRLSSPFQSGVPQGKLFTADDAAARLLQVIDGLTSEDSGSFFAWDGSKIPW